MNQIEISSSTVLVYSEFSDQQASWKCAVCFLCMCIQTPSLN